MMKKKYEIDMCNGPLFGKLIIFAVPLMLSGILQRLFNAIDSMIVGQFAGNDSFAAVGSTSSLSSLLIDLFIGLSVGVNVLSASYYGAGKKKELTQTVRTSLSMALLCGMLLSVIGILFSAPLLRLMDTPEDILDKAVLYMRIYFCSMPAMLLYNFGSAVLRAFGDTRRPFYYLLTAGLLKIVLSLFFVLGLQRNVDGVALATVISQYISAILILRCLKRISPEYTFPLRSPILVSDRLRQILTLGIPAGIQAIVFSLANVLIQSSVNSFGSDAIAGNSAASTLEGFVYTSMNALYQTAICFTGQNYGAGKHKRIGKTLLYCQLTVFTTGFVLGNLLYLFSEPLLHLYTSVPDAVRVGQLRMSFVCLTYFLCGMMEVMAGVLRGLGYSLMPTLISVVGVCGIRIGWNLIVFARIQTLDTLYWCYPLSWGVTFLLYLISFLILLKRRHHNSKMMMPTVQ